MQLEEYNACIITSDGSHDDDGTLAMNSDSQCLACLLLLRGMQASTGSAAPVSP